MKVSSQGTRATKAANAPLLRALRKRMKTVNVPLHVPGHKLGRQVLDEFRHMIGDEALKLDYTEVPGLDYLSCPMGVLAESQRIAADVFGAEQTFYLINGSTVGIHAAILATCPQGSVCLMGRNCHVSAYNGVKLSGCIPEYLVPEYDRKNGVCHGVTAKTVEQGLQKCKKERKTVGCVFVVSPTYFGAVSDIRGIAEACHRFGVPLIVDAAHGAHFRFHRAFPEDPLACGADIVIHSTHKVLTSLTQSSMLHMNSSHISIEGVAKWLSILQSSSPSHLLMASLEAAALHVSEEGVFDEPVLSAELAAEGLRAIPGLSIVSDENSFESVVAFDPLRLCTNVSQWGVHASEVSEALDVEFGIVSELITPQLIVFVFGPGSVVDDAQQLVDALSHISDRFRPHCLRDVLPFGSSLVIPDMEVTPFVAFSSPSRRVVLEEAESMVCAEMITPYPPGIPLVVPGEKISSELINSLELLRNNGANVVGANDGTLRTISVLA